MIRRVVVSCLSCLLAAGVGCGLLLPEVSDLSATGEADGGDDGSAVEGGEGDAQGDASSDADFDPCDGASPRKIFANLFVVGGFSSDDQGDAAASLDVLGATLACDGEAGVFHVVGTLPQALVGPAVAVLEGHLVVVGGHTLDGSLTSRAYVASATDGGWGSFQTVPSVDAGFRDGLQFASDGRFLVIMGGYIDVGTPLGDVHLLRLTADGQLSTTTSSSSMPERASGQAAYAQGVLFVGGGTSLSGGVSDVQATLSSDGSIGEWTPSGVETPAVIVDGVALGDRNTCLFLGRPGGIEGTSCVGFRATAAENRLATVTLTDPNLLDTRGAAAVANGFAYFVGGQDDAGLVYGRYVRLATLAAAQQTVISLPSLPHGRYGHRLVVY